MDDVWTYGLGDVEWALSELGHFDTCRTCAGDVVPGQDVVGDDAGDVAHASCAGYDVA